MAEGAELEIKLAVTDSRLFEVILTDPQILKLSHGNAPLTRNFEALYFDTPSFALQRQGFAYRIRREGPEWIATVKCDRSSGGGLTVRSAGSGDIHHSGVVGKVDVPKRHEDD